MYFDAVVRHGGFTRAGEQLHIAQPAISAQVRRLESELGVVLLQRSTRRVALTHAGEMFLDRARRVLEELDAARADLDDLSSVLRGQIRIGTTQVLGSLELPTVMASFRRRYPGVMLSLRTGLVTDLLAALDIGTLDVVIGPVHPEHPPRYTIHHLAEETLVLVLPPGHRLASDRSGVLTAARDEPFVCLPAGSGLHTLLTKAAATGGFVPRIDFETDSPASIRELVSAGLGVALLAGSAVRAPGPPVDIYPLAAPPRHPAISVFTPSSDARTPAAREFVSYLRRELNANIRC